MWAAARFQQPTPQLRPQGEEEEAAKAVAALARTSTNGHACPASTTSHPSCPATISASHRATEAFQTWLQALCVRANELLVMMMMMLMTLVMLLLRMMMIMNACDTA